MNKSQEISLPTSVLGNDRMFKMEFNREGDVKLLFWRQKFNDSTSMTRSKVQNFTMTHGSELSLLSSFVSYYKRAGISEEQIRYDFITAASPILNDKSCALNDNSRLNESVRHALYVANSEPFARFNKTAVGWECLHIPIPTQPGIIEEVGGTGIYARTDIFGDQLIVLAYEKSDEDILFPEESYPLIELCRTDILPMARTICELTMGEYRSNIYDFMQSRFLNAGSLNDQIINTLKS
jgi:hypothetical protein